MSCFTSSTPLLQVVENGDGSDIARDPPAVLDPSPYYDWTFDAVANLDFIADIRTAETLRTGGDDSK